MKIRKIVILSMASVVLSWAFSACQQDKKVEYAQGGGIEQEAVLPLVPEGGLARFVLATDNESLRKKVGGSAHHFSSEDEIYVKSTVFHPVIGGDGTAYLDVPESATGTYKMFCYPEGSKFWFVADGNYPLKDLIIPYSQFYGKTAQELANYPMFAEYSEATGNRMAFKEVISALDITLKGSAKIASVHIENKASGESNDNNLAGVASYSLENGYTLDEGVNFVNLNCTNEGEGVALTATGTHFYLLLSKGSYASGLTLTVTDMDHKGQVFAIPAFAVAAGEIKSFSYDYAPDADLVFFEHFDNFVWGGHVKGNSAQCAYAPTASTNPNENPTERTGRENAFVKIGNATPGSALIQANWASVNGWTVWERPSVSKEYVKSRNIGDYSYLYRCQEFQGCVCCGAADETRGAIQPALFSSLKEGDYYEATVSYDFCFRYGTEDIFSTHVNENGMVTEVLIDGNPLELSTAIEGNNTYTHGFLNTCTMTRGDIKAPTSDEYKDGWHHLQMKIVNVTPTTTFGLWGVDTETSVKHGHFVDNLEIRVRKQVPTQRLRVMLYNVQNGMWADQGNDFDNFVAWVKKYDPDVCIFCESQSIYKTGTSQTASQSEWPLFTNKKGDRISSDATTAYVDAKWSALAKRWGHNYSAVSGWRDNYPQVVTSKTNITTVRRIVEGNTSGQPIQHGAGHFQITSYGQVINIVTCHMWPQIFWPGRDTPASRAAQEGRDYEKYEAQSIMTKTVKAYSGQPNWLLMGDTNAISPIDVPYYDYYEVYQDTKEKWVYAHQVFRSPSYGRQLYDMSREGAGSPYKGEGRFLTSTGGMGRIDIMYGSEAMMRRVTSTSLTIKDAWCNPVASPIYDPEVDTQHFYYPSDHRPVLVDFDMSK
ncbi:MAG: hypothetical protein K5651_03545 [Bacteroidales bacterium]|nr:hypothetical protein [Bacteroidales bacterium]